MSFIETEEGLGNPQPEFNFKKYLIKLLRRWPYILGFFIGCVAIGYVINRYATPTYAVTARITTKKFSGKSSNLVPGLVDANFFLGGLTEVYEEIPTLKSAKRISATIDKLDFRVSYYAKGFVKNTENVRGFGFDVVVDTISGSSYPHGVPIFVNHLSEKEFQLHIEDDDGDDKWQDRVSGKTFRFDEPFKLGGATLTVINSNGKTAEHDKYFFVLNRKADLVYEYRRKLNISWAMKGSAMLDLRIESESPERDLEFLKKYYEVVEELGLEEKNETLDNTIKFIDVQMDIVTDSLVYYQELIDQMKLRNLELTHGNEFVFNKLNELDQQKATIILNERYFDYLIDYFNSKSDGEVFAPSLIGLNIPPLEGWVNQYIQSRLNEKVQRNLENAQNPLVNREDSLKRRLVKGIFESINSARERNRQLLADLNGQANKLYGSVGNLQDEFRQLSTFERMYQLNQTLFDLFLRRKTEAAISKASATSDYKIIEAPSYSKRPIKPDEDLNLMIAAAIGLILPIGFFLTRDITNNKIVDKDDLQSHTQIPILGNVAHSKYELNLVIRDHPKSVVAESFRAVRANLKYLVNNDSKASVFLITSSVGGEGKTFCSLNLAYTLSLSDKKTILIGADLRKPQLAGYMENSGSEKGLSELLAGLANIDDVILPGKEGSSPDVIHAGAIPPNPSELLGSENMTRLVEELKRRYHYIIIDTPPIGLVSDAMELFKFTDYNILIVRQNVTHKAALSMINDLYLEGKLKNFTVLFNDLELNPKTGSYYGGYLYGMGYSGYGYGYYQEDKKNR